jgi:hypothetical protein
VKRVVNMRWVYQLLNSRVHGGIQQQLGKWRTSTYNFISAMAGRSVLTSIAVSEILFLYSFYLSISPPFYSPFCLSGLLFFLSAIRRRYNT